MADSGKAAIGTQVPGFPGQCDFCYILWPVRLCPDGTGERSNNISELPEATLREARLRVEGRHTEVHALSGSLVFLVDPMQEIQAELEGPLASPWLFFLPFPTSGWAKRVALKPIPHRQFCRAPSSQPPTNAVKSLSEAQGQSPAGCPTQRRPVVVSGAGESMGVCHYLPSPQSQISYSPALGTPAVL